MAKDPPLEMPAAGKEDMLATALREARERYLAPVQTPGKRRVSKVSVEEAAQRMQAAGIRISAHMLYKYESRSDPAPLPRDLARQIADFYHENLWEKWTHVYYNGDDDEDKND